MAFSLNDGRTVVARVGVDDPETVGLGMLICPTVSLTLRSGMGITRWWRLGTGAV